MMASTAEQKCAFPCRPFCALSSGFSFLLFLLICCTVCIAVPDNSTTPSPLNGTTPVVPTPTTLAPPKRVARGANDSSDAPVATTAASPADAGNSTSGSGNATTAEPVTTTIDWWGSMAVTQPQMDSGDNGQGNVSPVLLDSSNSTVSTVNGTLPTLNSTLAAPAASSSSGNATTAPASGNSTAAPKSSGIRVNGQHLGVGICAAIFLSFAISVLLG